MNSPNPKRSTLVLYTSPECELCVQAESIVLPFIENTHWQLEKVNIQSDSELQEKYGWTIPVLKRIDNGSELNWPFPPSRVRQLLG